MCAPLSSTKGTQGNVQREGQKTSELGDIKEVNDFEWGAHFSAQPKPKTNRVRFLGEFWNLSSKLKCKPDPMPKIREMLLNLEVFQYAKSLDLNMGYYHIFLSD